jgi:hypothetical protein
MGQRRAMDSDIETFTQTERDMLRDRFADFERSVLQDNIILCDGKSGVLLAFDGAMVIFCVDTFVERQRAIHAIDLLHEAQVALFVAAAVAFLVSCHFGLTTIVPRLRRGRPDHIFWEAPIFSLGEEGYAQEMRKLDVATAWSDKLRHLHLLAGICKSKFQHFHIAIRTAQVGFLTLVVAELGRLVG